RLVTTRQVEHRVVQCMEAGQRDELEATTHRGKLALGLRAGCAIEGAPPAERRRAVIGKQLAGELPVQAVGELPGLLKIRLAGLAPHQIHVRRVSATACDRLLHAGLDAEEAFRGAPLRLVYKGSV